MRNRIRSSASLNVPPGKLLEVMVIKLEIMNYELGRTKTANIKDPTFNGALGRRDKTACGLFARLRLIPGSGVVDGTKERNTVTRTRTTSASYRRPTEVCWRVRGLRSTRRPLLP